MKNILLCNNAMDIGGVETVILNQITAFTKKGYNVYVLAGKGKYSNKIEELGGKFIEFDYPEENEINEERVKKIVEIIEKNRITEIHIHKYQCIPSTMLAAFITNVPYFAYEHGIRDTKKYYTWNYPIYKMLFPIYFANAYKIIAITPKVAEMTQKEYQIMPEKYEVIHNGIDFEKYINEKPNYAGNLNNIYIISRISEEKLTTIIEGIEIFKKIFEDNSEAKLYIIGDGKEKEKIIQYLTEIKLAYSQSKEESTVNLLGEQTDIINYLKKADLLLGVDRCVLEAIAMKTPAVITGYNGIKGLVSKDNINIALEENFSGDNMETISIGKCIEEIYKLKENKEKIIEENYAVAREKLDCYKNYINIPDNKHIDFEWLKIFNLIQKNIELIEEQYVDIKAKYDWIQKIDKENEKLNKKNGQLEEKIKCDLEEEKKLKERNETLKEQNEKIKKELKEVYDSKRWRYTEKLSNFFHRGN